MFEAITRAMVETLERVLKIHLEEKEPKAMALKLEVGKSYKDGGGRVYKIDSFWDGHNYPYFAGEWAFKENGSFYNNGHPRDLIEEVKEGLQLEVGKSYKSRDGVIVTISNRQGNDAQPFWSDGIGYYTPDGKFYIDGPVSGNDLLGECTVLKLEVGKSYKNHSGEIVKIINYTERSAIPYRRADGCGYTEDGFWCSDKSHDRRNLIEEVLIEGKLDLEVGKKYKNGAGDIVTITNLPGGGMPFSGDNGFYFNAEGMAFPTDPAHKANLVAEYVGLSLEVGGRYKNKHGTIVKIINTTGVRERPFQGDDGCIYRADGGFNEKGSDHSDLIAEVVAEDKKDEKKKDKKDKKMFKLEVGKAYRTKDGKIVVIEKIGQSDSYKYVGDNTVTYLENGKRYSWSDEDALIEEATMEDKKKDKKEDKKRGPEVPPVGLKLKLGAHYLSFGGAIVQINDRAKHGDYQYIATVTDCRGVVLGKSELYREGGWYQKADVPSCLNIQKEITAEEAAQLTIKAIKKTSPEVSETTQPQVWRKANDCYPWGSWVQSGSKKTG